MGATCCWFAMRATYKRELVAQEYLTGKGFEVFVPLRKVIKVVRGIKRKVTEPAIKGLIFVKAEKEALKKAKFGLEYLQYITRRDGERNVPIIVPERQMEQFIAVCNTYNEKLVYLNPEEINLEKGTPVQIIGGAFDGVEGTFIKIEGVRNRRVAVLVPGIAAVVIADITKGCLKVLD